MTKPRKFEPEPVSVEVATGVEAPGGSGSASHAAESLERCADCGEPFTNGVCQTMQCGYQWQRVVPDPPQSAVTDQSHAHAVRTTPRVKCPWCGRKIETFDHPDYGRVMMGHRVAGRHTFSTPWCEGGGRGA